MPSSPTPTGFIQRAPLAFVLLTALALPIGCADDGPPNSSGTPPSNGVPVCPAYDASAFSGGLETTATAHAGSVGGSFSVDPNGSATYAIPITVPPGRAGAEPSLGLAYNSADREDIAGQGFALHGLSSITRCPSYVNEDRKIREVRYDADDKFCLDGARLVPVGTSHARDPLGAIQTEYRTLPDAILKVVSYADSEARGPRGWRVWQKDGRIFTYGTKNGAAARAQNHVIRSWAVIRSRIEAVTPFRTTTTTSRPGSETPTTRSTRRSHPSPMAHTSTRPSSRTRASSSSTTRRPPILASRSPGECGSRAHSG